MRSWILASLVALLSQTIVAASDYHYTIRYTWNARPSEVTYWISSDKIRVEHRSAYGDAKGKMKYGPRLASIMDCATRQGVELNLDDRQYANETLPAPVTEAEIKRWKDKAAKVPQPAKVEPSITVETNTTETREKQTLFGHEARHFTSTTRIIRHHQPELVNENATDGWYFDFYPKTGCQPAAYNLKGNTVSVLMLGGRGIDSPRDFEVKYNGPKLPGMPVKATMRSHQSYRAQDGSLKDTTHVSETEIVGFSEAPLDPALFQVPPGFKKVTRIVDAPPLDFTERVQYWWERMKYDLSQLFH